MGKIYIDDSKKSKELASIVNKFSPIERKRFLARSFVKIGTNVAAEAQLSKILRGQGFYKKEVDHARKMGRKGRKIGFEF